uniref:Uncharacterized protein n=1 Tax=Rhizophora mucronata TaxID=61149 RepID=A0A2P2NKT0_RHIMU
MGFLQSIHLASPPPTGSSFLLRCCRNLS